MTAPQDALESVAERARRALRDNAEAHLLDRQMVRGEPAAEPQHPSPSQPVESVSPHQPEPHQPVESASPQPPSGNQAAPAQPTPAVPVEPAPLPAEAEQHYGGHEHGGMLEHLELRMRAIHTVRELEPRRTCFRLRVQELARRLAQTAADSVHYGQLLQQLAEAHGELSRLEGEVETAQHMIRSTEWLMEMLSDPARA